MQQLPLFTLLTYHSVWEPSRRDIISCRRFSLISMSGDTDVYGSYLELFTFRLESSVVIHLLEAVTPDLSALTSFCTLACLQSFCCREAGNRDQWHSFIFLAGVWAWRDQRYVTWSEDQQDQETNKREEMKKQVLGFLCCPSVLFPLVQTYCSRFLVWCVNYKKKKVIPFYKIYKKLTFYLTCDHTMTCRRAAVIDSQIRCNAVKLRP